MEVVLLVHNAFLIRIKGSVVSQMCSTYFQPQSVFRKSALQPARAASWYLTNGRQHKATTIICIDFESVDFYDKNKIISGGFFHI